MARVVIPWNNALRFCNFLLLRTRYTPWANAVTARALALALAPTHALDHARVHISNVYIEIVITIHAVRIRLWASHKLVVSLVSADTASLNYSMLTFKRLNWFYQPPLHRRLLWRSTLLLWRPIRLWLAWLIRHSLDYVTHWTSQPCHEISAWPTKLFATNCRVRPRQSYATASWHITLGYFFSTTTIICCSRQMSSLVDNEDVVFFLKRRHMSRQRSTRFALLVINEFALVD